MFGRDSSFLGGIGHPDPQPFDQESGTLDLPDYSRLADDASKLSVEHLTKPEKLLPWDGHLGSDTQHDGFSFPDQFYERPKTGAFTEPFSCSHASRLQCDLSHGGSETADSGYATQLLSDFHGHHHAEESRRVPPGDRSDTMSVDRIGLSLSSRRQQHDRSCIPLNTSNRTRSRSKAGSCHICGRAAKNHSDARRVLASSQAMGRNLTFSLGSML